MYCDVYIVSVCTCVSSHALCVYISDVYVLYVRRVSDCVCMCVCACVCVCAHMCVYVCVCGVSVCMYNIFNSAVRQNTAMSNILEHSIINY